MPIINVRSKGPHFRRAGLAFTAEGVAIDTDKLSKEQLKAIESEPQLVIATVEPTRENKDRKKKDE